jgi:hypothetical protein
MRSQRVLGAGGSPLRGATCVSVGAFVSIARQSGQKKYRSSHLRADEATSSFYLRQGSKDFILCRSRPDPSEKNPEQAPIAQWGSRGAPP